MLKKLIPFVLLVFVSACANTPSGTATGMGMKMPCCEKCECCKSCKSGDCCKNGKCNCCKDGTCQMCMKSNQAMKDGEDCPICAKAEREWKAKHGKQE